MENAFHKEQHTDVTVKQVILDNSAKRIYAKIILVEFTEPVIELSVE